MIKTFNNKEPLVLICTMNLLLGKPHCAGNKS